MLLAKTTPTEDGAATMTVRGSTKEGLRMALELALFMVSCEPNQWRSTPAVMAEDVAEVFTAKRPVRQQPSLILSRTYTEPFDHHYPLPDGAPIIEIAMGWVWHAQPAGDSSSGNVAGWKVSASCDVITVERAWGYNGK